VLQWLSQMLLLHQLFFSNNNSNEINVYIPESHQWTWGGHILFHDYDSYSLRSVDENIVQVTVRFEKSEKVNWEIQTKNFFK
jgi:hypothetical protein